MPKVQDMHPHELAHVWGQCLETCYRYEHKSGMQSHDMRMSGRIAEMRSMEQSVGHYRRQAAKESIKVG